MNNYLRDHGEADIKKSDRFYLRYYLTVKRAKELNRAVYGGKTDKTGKESKEQHPLRVAYMTETIKHQSIGDYHMTWLVGLLHDTKEDATLLYQENIDSVLSDLLPEERERVKDYIDQLTPDQLLEKGQKKRWQIESMKKMDIVPTWIRIFDKYDNCRRFRDDPAGKKKDEVDGYLAVAYRCYQEGIYKHPKIKQNLQNYILEFYAQICEDLKGDEGVMKVSEQYLSKWS